MKSLFFCKAALVAVLLSVNALHTNAQKIQEQELKTKVTGLSNPLNRLMKLEPILFQYNLTKFNYLKLPSGNQYGFRIGGVKAEFPEMLTETGRVYTAGKNNSKVVKYDEVQNDHLIPVLVAAIKEQQVQIEQLKQELLELREKAR